MYITLCFVVVPQSSDILLFFQVFVFISFRFWKFLLIYPQRYFLQPYLVYCKPIKDIILLVTVFFISSIFLRMFISVFTLPTYSCILSILFIRALSILTIVVLNFVSNNSNILAISDSGFDASFASSTYGFFFFLIFSMFCNIFLIARYDEPGKRNYFVWAFSNLLLWSRGSGKHSIVPCLGLKLLVSLCSWTVNFTSASVSPLSL